MIPDSVLLRQHVLHSALDAQLAFAERGAPVRHCDLSDS